MARLLGEARVSVLPDGTRFKAEAEAIVKKGMAGVTAKIPITLDDKALQAKIAGIKTKIDQLRAESVSIKIDADDKAGTAKVAAFQAQLSKLSETVAKAKTDVDIDQALAKMTAIDAAMDKFRVKDATAHANVDTGDDIVKLGIVSLLLDKFGKMRVTARANINTDAGKAALGGLLSYISGRFTKEVASRSESSGNKFGGSFITGLGKSALMQNPGITALVIAGMAALPAAIGAVGVLGGIALGAGIITAAIVTIKAQSKTAATALAQNVAQLNKDVSAKAPKSTILGDKDAVAAAQQGLTAVNKELSAYNMLITAVGNLKQAFLNFAVVVSKPLIKPFSDAVNELTDQLNGPLRGAFTALFKAVGPLVKPVADALLEIVDGILPGMTDMLNKARAPLSALFENFGKIVGLKVGQWFRDAIPYISASVTYFNKLISILGDVGSYLIKFGGESAKAFAGGQFKDFGSLISSIANSLLKIVIPAFEGWTAVMAPVAKEILEIVAPILAWLAANPGLVKAIFETIAVLMILSKTMTILIGVTDLLGLSMDALPFVAIAAAVIVATILIIKYWGPISGFFVKIWKEIWSGAIGPMINFFTETIPHAFGVTIDWLKKNWPLITAIIGGPIGAIAALVITKWNTIFTFLKHIWGDIENVATGTFKPIASVIEGVWNVITKITKDAWNVIAGVIKFQILIIVGVIGEAWRGIKNLTGIVWPWLYATTKDIWGKIENAITGVVKPLVNTVEGAWKAIANATTVAWTAVYNTSKTLWGHIENVVTGAAKPTASGVHTAWKNTMGWTVDAWNYISHISQVVWGKISPYVIGTAKGMATSVFSTWKNLTGWTNNAFLAIYHDILTPLNKAQSWIANTFVHGVESAFKGLVSTVSAIWDGLRKAVGVPVNFVINDIWNPFTRFVNAGLSVFGIKDKLTPGTPVKFSTGGGVPGFAPGQDSVHAILSPGEYVLNPTAVKAFGKRNLDAINSTYKTGSPVQSGVQRFASGGDVVADAEKWNGHRYVWGGGANPTTGWDCSSFVNYIVGHDFKLNLPGGGSWAQETQGGVAHGPVVAQYNDWNYGHAVPWSNAKKGDLALENNAGHIGFITQDNTDSKNIPLQGFAARSTATGTGYQMYYPQDFHLMRFADDRGFGAEVFDNTIGAVLKEAASFALNGVDSILNGALNHIPGKGPIQPIAKAAIAKIMNAAKSKLTGNQNNYEFLGTSSFGPDGTGTSGGEMANGTQLYEYLLANLFNGNKIAAAGAAASIFGESAWNPFAVGTGGRGLIGWTPPSTISDAAFNGGMATQLPAIIQFVSRNGDQGAIAEMETAPNVAAAANIWGPKVERFGINDVHPEGIALATQIMNAASTSANTKTATKKAMGGLIKGFSQGGWINEKVVGVGTSSGMPYSFAENGPEKITPASGSASGPMGMSADQAERLIAAVERNTMATISGDRQTNKNLGHVGRGVF